jgi:hypothetical protein
MPKRKSLYAPADVRAKKCGFPSAAEQEVLVTLLQLEESKLPRHSAKHRTEYTIHWARHLRYPSHGAQHQTRAALFNMQSRPPHARLVGYKWLPGHIWHLTKKGREVAARLLEIHSALGMRRQPCA